MKKTVRFPCIECTDHTGVTYPSIKEMCAHWGIQPETYTRRIRVYHMGVEEALTTPVKPNGGQACRDHQGTRFRSRSLMCDHWPYLSRMESRRCVNQTASQIFTDILCIARCYLVLLRNIIKACNRLRPATGLLFCI